MKNFLLLLLAGIVVIETAELLGIIDLICEKGCDCEERYAGFEELEGGGAQVSVERVRDAEKVFMSAYPSYKCGAMFSKKAVEALFNAHDDHNAIFVAAGLTVTDSDSSLNFYLGSLKSDHTLIKTGTASIDAFIAEVFCPVECGVFAP